MSFYYHNSDYQWGGGNAVSGGIGQIYVGTPFQRGAGIGSFLGGVFRYVLPLLKRGAKAVGKEFLQTGLNVASDVGDLKKPFKESLKNRLRQSGSNLQQKAKDNLDRFMRGEGYKVGSASLPPHLASALRGRAKKKKSNRKKVVKKKIKKKIFTKKEEKKKKKKKKAKKNKTGKKKEFVDIFR